MRIKTTHKKIFKKKISSFLMSIIFLSNIFPVFSVTAFAEGEESPATPVTESVPAEPVNTPEPAPEPTPEQSTQQTNNPEPENTNTSPATNTPVVTENISTSSENTSEQNSNENIATSTTENTGATSTEIILDYTTSTDAFVGTSSPIFGLTSFATTTVGTTTEAISTTTEILIIDQNILDELGTSTLPVGTTTIDTGDAVSTANLLNILNTNSINSTGTIQMANFETGHTGNLDFRSGMDANSTTTCTLLECNGVESITAQFENDASIENVLALQASSGSNTIQTAGGGIINTGNSYAGLNLVNVANTNIIDSNYFVLTLNSFDTINGDIILPSLYKFFSSLVGLSSDNTNINVVQNADTQNNLNLQANTGTNTAENSLSSLTNTGDATTITNVYNNINTNMFGGKSIYVLLRITGKWLGQFLGLPEGVEATQDGNVYALEITDGQVSGLQRADTEIFGTSTAKIINDVNMNADTGNNLIRDTNNAEINTGDATVVANVVNLANTNIVGKNWMLAVINIFGDLNGDIVFGVPDLGVSQTVDREPQIQDGQFINYNLKIKNNGDSPATVVKLLANYDKTHLDIVEASLPYVTDDASNLIFNLGTLMAGESREINFKTRVKNFSTGQNIANTISASLHEKDYNLENNSNTQNISNPVSGGGGGQITYNQNFVNNPTANIIDQNGFIITANNFSVRRVPEVVNISEGNSEVEQKIILTNLTSQEIPGVVFDDFMYDENGVEVQRESWVLGKIAPREEIELSYKMSFGNSKRIGNYSFSSVLNYDVGQKIIFGNNGKIILEKEKVAIEDFEKNISLKSKNNLAFEYVPEEKNISTTTGIMDLQEISTTTLAFATNKDLDSSYSKQGGTFDLKNLYYLFLICVAYLLSTVYVYRRQNF